MLGLRVHLLDLTAHCLGHISKERQMEGQGHLGCNSRESGSWWFTVYTFAHFFGVFIGFFTQFFWMVVLMCNVLIYIL